MLKIVLGLFFDRNLVEGKLSYKDFVWFLISEEDKRNPRRLLICYFCDIYCAVIFSFVVSYISFICLVDIIVVFLLLKSFS